MHFLSSQTDYIIRFNYNNSVNLEISLENKKNYVYFMENNVNKVKTGIDIYSNMCIYRLSNNLCVMIKISGRNKEYGAPCT